MPSDILVAAAERAHRETVAQSAEENNEFLERHREAFETLARDHWDPWSAWNYLWDLGDSSRQNLPHAEVLARARVAREVDEVGVNFLMEESDIDAPEGWTATVLALVRVGYDVDYLQAFVLTFMLLENRMFSPDDMLRLLRDADLRVLTFDLVPGLAQVYGEPPSDDDVDGDQEMGFMELGDTEFAGQEMGNANQDEDVGDEFGTEDHGSDLSDHSEDSLGPPTPIQGRFEVIMFPDGGRRFVTATTADRDRLIASGNYVETFNEAGTISYIAPIEDHHPDEDVEEEDFSLPDYVSPTPQPLSRPASASSGPSQRPLPDYSGEENYSYDDSYPSDDSERSQELRAQFVDDFYEHVLGDLEGPAVYLPEERVPEEGEYSDGYETPEDGPVAAGLPPPSPPGGGVGGQVESPESDDGLILKRRGGPASPGRSSTRSSPRSPPQSSSPSVPRPIDEDEPSDDDSTGADLPDDDPPDGDGDNQVQREPIHDRLVAAESGRNDIFVATHRAVFSVLAADSWTPYMAWRFVRWLFVITGGNSTIAELIQIVTAIDEDQLHDEYTYVEEDELIRRFAHDAQLAETVRTLYRAGVDSEYLNSYITELEAEGRPPRVIEDEFEGHDAELVRAWLWDWAPAMWEIWNDAGQTDDAPISSVTSPAPVQKVPSPVVRSTPRQSTQPSNTISPARGTPPRPSGSQPYSPSYPPIAPSSDAPIPATFEYSSPQASPNGSESMRRRPSQSSRTPQSPSRTIPDVNGPTAERLARIRWPHSHGRTPTSRRSSSYALQSPTASRLAQMTDGFVPASQSPCPIPDTPTSSQLARDRNLSLASSGSRFVPGSPLYEPSPAASRRSHSPVHPPTSASPQRVHSAPLYAPRSPGVPSSSASGLLRSPTVRYDPVSPLLRRTSSSLGSRRSSAGRILDNDPRTSTPPCGSRPSGTSPASQPRSILRRGDRVPLVDPLRYTNRLTPPRRLPDTPTRSHQPPSPRRSGPRQRVCGECGHLYNRTPPPVSNPTRTLGGRVAKTPSPVVRKTPTPVVKKSGSPIVKKSSSPGVTREASSPAPSSSPSSTAPSSLSASSGSAIAVVKVAGRRSAATKQVVKKAAAKKAAAKKAAARNAAVKKAAVKKVAVTKAAAAPRRSGRVTRRPDFLGS